MSLKIIGVGKGIPKRSVTNNELSGFLDTSDEWISSRTGIKSRQVCSDESITDLSVTAALQALEGAGLTANNIDLIICTTICGDYRTPSLAFCVAERIGAACAAFDINAACTGFVYALELAAGFITRQSAKNILIVCAERMSTQMDWSDRNTCVLFGDGAAACVVTAGNALRYLKLSGAPNTEILNLPLGTGNSPFVTHKKEDGYLVMQGQEVFKTAVSLVEAEIKQALGALGLSAEQVDWFLLHQANLRIVNAVIGKLQQLADKFPCNIDRYGNLSSASVPLLLFELLENKSIQPGDTLLMTAFGAGMTSGCCVMVWE